MDHKVKIKVIYQIVVAQTKSGLSLRAFADEKKIPHSILHRWRSKFIADSPARSDEWIKIAGSVQRITYSDTASEKYVEDALKWLKIDLNAL